MTSGGLWNYHRDQVNDSENNNTNDCRINNNKTKTSISFKHSK